MPCRRYIKVNVCFTILFLYIPCQIRFNMNYLDVQTKIKFMHLLVQHIPIGPHSHFQMIAIANKLNADVPISILWNYLSSLYNLDELVIWTRALSIMILWNLRNSRTIWMRWILRSRISIYRNHSMIWKSSVFRGIRIPVIGFMIYIAPIFASPIEISSKMADDANNDSSRSQRSRRTKHV